MKWIHNNYLSRSVSGVGDNTTFEPQTLHWKTVVAAHRWSGQDDIRQATSVRRISDKSDALGQSL
jgi:hypothetical protein